MTGKRKLALRLNVLLCRRSAERLNVHHNLKDQSSSALSELRKGPRDTVGLFAYGECALNSSVNKVDY